MHSTDTPILIWDNKNAISSDTGYYSLVKIDELCVGNDFDSNLLIHGDNLEAMKVLVSTYEGRIKCAYLDPPYNSSFSYYHYSDALSHSGWLSMMKERIIIIFSLLKDDGFLFAQIDNRELHYLKILLDEIFGRINYRNSLIVKKGIPDTTGTNCTSLQTGYNTILVYSKTPHTTLPCLFRKTKADEKVGRWKNFERATKSYQHDYELLGIRPKYGEWRWEQKRAEQALENYFHILDVFKISQAVKCEQQKFDQMIAEYAQNIDVPAETFDLLRPIKIGYELYIPPSEIVCLSDDWMDIHVEGDITDFEHEVSEEILDRLIGWVTQKDDIILDPFLGSGTTLIVASRLNRKWIGIEKGEHCRGLCHQRLSAFYRESIENSSDNAYGFGFFELRRLSKGDKNE